jgi:hypothetical protein
VAIDVEHDAVTITLGSSVMCQFAEPGEIVAGIQSLAVRTRKPLSRVHLLLKLTLHAFVHVG